MSATPSDMPSIPHLLQAHLPGWQSAPTTATDPNRLSDSFTNLVYRVQNPEATPKIVLLRIYGKGGVISQKARNQELNVHNQLAKAGIAPPIHATFPIGRVEHFIHARPLALSEVCQPAFVPRIAAAVARLHLFQPTGPIFGPEPEPELWDVLAEWVRRAGQMDKLGAFAGSGLGGEIGRWKERVREARRLVDSKGSAVVVFCHNDLYRGNILLSEDEDVSLIDFEYSSFNYRGFDIGNFFCEAMGGTDDGVLDESRYPAHEVRRAFCRAYLEEFHGKSAEEAAVERLLEEAEFYGRLSHLYYGFWALVQSGVADSDVDFPHLKYAEHRFRLYARLLVSDGRA